MSSNDIQTGPSPIDQSPGFFDKTRNRVATGVAGAVAASTIVFGIVVASNGESQSSDSTPDGTASGLEYDVESGCADLVQTYAANVGDNYTPSAFLPTSESKDASVIIDSFFDKNGPLSNEGDFASLAAFVSAVSGPANDGSTIDPEYSYGQAFEDNFTRFSNEGVGAARDACQVAWDTARQTASYDDRAIADGDVVTRLTAIRDETTNNIIALTPERLTTNRRVSGVVFALPGAQGELDGFTTVVYEGSTGDLFVTGTTNGQGLRFDIDGNPVNLDPNATETIPVSPNVTDGVEAPVTTIEKENGQVIEVKEVITPEGKKITVTIDQNGNEVAVNPKTGEKTGEKIPKGSTTVEGTTPVEGSIPVNGTIPAEVTIPGTTTPAPGTTTPSGHTTTTVSRGGTTTTVKPTTTTTTEPFVTTTTVKVPGSTTTTTSSTTSTSTIPKAPQPATTTSIPGGY